MLRYNFERSICSNRFVQPGVKEMTTILNSPRRATNTIGDKFTVIRFREVHSWLANKFDLVWLN